MRFKIASLVALFSILNLGLFAQNMDSTFAKQWLEIDTLIISKNLTQQALQKVNILYAKAKKQQLYAQQIKCLLYQFGLEEKVTDNNPNKRIATLKAEINSTDNVVMQGILYALLAKQYQNYFNQNRYKLYGRSNIANLKNADILTWSANDFHTAITANYLLSLNAKNALQQDNLSGYSAIILKGNTRHLRPTMFDLLAHEALNYFKTGEAYITKPSYAFVIDDASALSTMDVFVKASFTSKDTLSHLLNCLHIFQELINFHKNDIDALVDVDLERIQWVKQQAVMPNKGILYKAALEELTSRFSSNVNTSQAWYLLANIDAEKAGNYKPFEDTINRYNYVKAKQIIDSKLLQTKTDNEGSINLKNLLASIKTKIIAIQIEKVNVLNKPFRALVNYRNVDTIYNKIINISYNDSIQNKRWDNSFWDYANKLPSVKNFNQYLPLTNDYQQHATEIKIDALPVGAYALITSSGKGFKVDEDKMTVTYFYVSNISYVKNNNNDYYILNRETGEPINNATVVFLKKTYDYKNRKNYYETLATKKTNQQGYFNLKGFKISDDFEIIIESNGDRLRLRESEYYYNNNRQVVDDEKRSAVAYLFMDRSIYRPGQTIFFKGLAITKDQKNSQTKLYIFKDSITVYLRDANRKSIDSVRCLQNDFGSFTSSFILPQNVLTGSFSISIKQITNGNAKFSVEEYKRPTFYVNLEKPKGSYRLNDSITVIGSAKGFAGNAIDNVTIQFNVKRNTRFLYNDGWSRSGKQNQPANNIEITHGTITTDTEGKFEIKFVALPDKNLDRSTNRFFDYLVEAEVTDKAGETRKANSNVSVSYQALQLLVTVPNIVAADSLKSININTQNFAGVNEAANVQVKIFSLQSPQRIIRERLWQRADMFVMNRKEYENSFPNDDYNDDDNIANWTVDKLIIDKNINTENAEKLLLDAKLKSGYYKIEATTKDKYGEVVMVVKTVQVFSKSGLASPQNNFTYTINNTIESAQTAQFLAGTSHEKIYVLQQKIKQNNRGNYIYDSVIIIQRGKGLQAINYKAEEADRGGVNLQEVFVKNNRVYTNTYNIVVPFTNKELQINYATYRDKTEPGSKEKWTVTIRGNNGEQAAAELLTSMYDASLDQFIEHSWNKPNVWNSSNFYNGWNGGIGFGKVESFAYVFWEEIENENPITYDELVSNGEILWTLNAEAYYQNQSLKKNRKKKTGKVQHTNFTMPMVVADEHMSNLNGELSLNYSINKFYKIGTIKLSGTKSEGILEPPPSVKQDSTNELKMDDNRIVQTQIRSNFKETAFFIPQLYADSAGNYSFSFTMPDAVTQWKWQSFAHTKNLQFGTASTLVTTQKTLMVQSNAPRFLREGDNLEFSTKISNLSSKELTGQVVLELVDATTNSSVDGWFQNIFPTQYFTVAAGQSTAVKFPISIPFSYNKPLLWRVVAKAGDYSDGEEKIIPVVTNRQLVTESLPLLVNGDTTQHFIFDKLLNNTSETLTNESITVEYTANPIWYAVQALPYLMEYPYECAEQTFNRFYANALATYIVAKNPPIKQVFNKCENDTTSSKSNLAKNVELKQVLLQETPWVLQAENEAQQQKNIALLFDVVKMGEGINNSIEKLIQMQLDNGSFSWFKGGYEDRYMTNYILTGIGKLKLLGALTNDMTNKLSVLMNNALRYLDNKATEDYQNLQTTKANLKLQQVPSTQVQYLYMRSFFKDYSFTDKTAYNYYYNQGKQYWVTQNLYHQALLGLAFSRNGELDFVIKNILPSITENAINNNQGMYWKENYTSFWYQSPVEFESMMIGFMNEINQQKNNLIIAKNIADMRTWLILNKQTNNWKTTVATADACYALIAGNEAINNNKQVVIKLGNYNINSNQHKSQIGTGYFKQRIDGSNVKPEMGNVMVTTIAQNTAISKLDISYGSLYWQYFEDFDKITASTSPLSITKKLFVETNSDNGKVLSVVTENDELKIGDKIVIHLELRTDRDMDYVHLKDMRAATMEPINVLSSYKYQDGLSYYEATKDASTNFFFGNIRKGIYVFEYPVYLTHSGTFNIGIANLQCMYAPEFISHSEGMKIKVSER